MRADPAEPPAGWNPDGAVLVVRSIAGDVLVADVERRLPEARLVTLTIPTRRRPRKAWRRALELRFRKGLRARDPDAKGARAIRARLAADPRIGSVLALDTDAIRAARCALVHDRRVAGFAHLDHLEKAVRGRLAIDLTPAGARAFDSQHTIEAVLAAAPERAPGPLALGGANPDGRAHAMTAALARFAGIEAVSVAVGSSGFPADVMASARDWSLDDTRRLVLGELDSVTCMLVDWPGPPFVADGLAGELGHSVQAWLCDDPDAGLPESGHRFTTRHDMVATGCEWLPLCVPRGLLQQPVPVGMERFRVVVTSDPGTGLPLDAFPLAAEGEACPSGEGPVALESLDPLLQLPAAAMAGVIVDLRSRPIADLRVLSAIAGGAVWVANVNATAEKTGMLPPWVPAGPDPFATAASVLVDPMRRTLQASGRRFVRDRHDGRATAAVLARLLEDATVRE